MCAMRYVCDILFVCIMCDAIYCLFHYMCNVRRIYIVCKSLCITYMFDAIAYMLCIYIHSTMRDIVWM